MSSPPIPAATPVATPSRGFPFLRLGFRPFYLGAVVFAMLSVPLWVAIALGKVGAPMPMPALLWHAHVGATDVAYRYL